MHSYDKYSYFCETLVVNGFMCALFFVLTFVRQSCYAVQAKLNLT